MEKLEIYDEDTLNELELKRQNNIIRNYEFFKLCGKNVHYLVLLPCFVLCHSVSKWQERGWKLDTERVITMVITLW